MSEEKNPPHEPKQNVVKLRLHRKEAPENEGKVLADTLLEEAKGKLSGVVILGYTNDEDELEYFSSSFEDNVEILWLTERFKFLILSDSSDP